MIEKTAQTMHRRFAVIAVLSIIAALALVAWDMQSSWIAAGRADKAVKNIGESFGKIAFSLAIFAMLYYVLREVFVRTRRLGYKLPGWLDSFLKYWVGVLRMVHPVIGTLVFVAVLVHGYILWMIWSSGNMSAAVWTGLGAEGVLLLALISGFFIRMMPKVMAWRYFHRVAGIVFLVAYAVHKATE